MYQDFIKTTLLIDNNSIVDVVEAAIGSLY